MRSSPSLLCFFSHPQRELKAQEGLLRDRKLQSSLVAQWVKDPALSLLWLWLLLWQGFNPWPGNSDRGAAKKNPKQKITF